MTSAPVRVAVVAPPEERAWLVAALDAEGTVVAGATDRADQAAELVMATGAEVVVVDLGLEAGGGRRAIAEIMTAAPRPVLALVPRGAGEHGPAAGAVETHQRPRRDPAGQALLRERVRSLRGVSFLPQAGRASQRPALPEHHPAVRAHPAGSVLRPSRTQRPPLAAVTGAAAAVGDLLRSLDDVPFPVVVSVRLAPGLVDGYAAFLSRLTPLRVEAGAAGGTLEPGAALIISADLAVRVDPDLRLQPPRAGGGRPADELFTSVARAAGPAGIGVMLAGTGGDGQAGLRALSRAGGTVIVQDTAATTSNSVPDARILPLARIAPALRAAARRARG